MPGWIIAAAVGSIVLTAILTFVLWRVNQPMLERNKRKDDGGYGGAPVVADGGRRDGDYDNGGSDGGGGDGGGD